MSYDHYSQSKRGHKRHSASATVRFYRSLRGFLFLNIAMVFFRVTGFMFFLPWKVSLVWALILGFQYVRAFGWPGSNGMMSEEWEDSLEERELPRRYRRPEEPEPMMRSEGKRWRDKDLV